MADFIATINFITGFIILINAKMVLRNKNNIILIKEYINWVENPISHLILSIISIKSLKFYIF